MSERAGEIVLLAGLGVATALGASACGGLPSEQAIDNASMVQRYGFDYTGGVFESWSTQNSHSDCLEGSAYDLYQGWSDDAALKLESDGTIVVTPTTGTGSELRLRDEGPAMPLQPADEQAKGILAAYSCPTTPYER